MSHNRIIATTLVALWCTTLAGTLFAQYLPNLRITSTIDNAIIMVRNIFLSPSGRDTSNASIKLEWDQGNVTIGWDLVLSNARYSCPDSDGTGCVLAVKQGGSTDLTEVALPQDTTVIEDDVTITGDSFFAKKWWSTDHLNRSANEIVFADPDIVPNAADAHLRVNVKDVVRATTTGTPKMVDVNGAINSRTSLEVSSPLDTTQKSNYNLTNTARTDFILTKGDTATNEQSVRMKVWYHNGSQYTRQDMIILPIEVTQSPMVRDGIYCITKSSAGDYGVYWSRIYKSGFNRDSVWIENDNNDTYAHMHTSPQWQSSANPSIDWPSIRNGVRIDSDCDGTKDSLYAGQQITLWYSYYNTGSNRVIYVGMFGDNEFTLKVNDQTIIDTPLVPTSTNRWIEYRLYHIFPVEIKPGMNYFNIVGVGDGSVSDTIGMTIYNNTADQIKNATSDNSLNILFSTEQLVGQRISIATCPDWWILDTSGWYSDYVCRQTDTDTTVSHTGAKLGINTSGYPEHTLDVNGETLSQETLTVWYLNSGNVVTNIRQSVGIMIQNPSPSAQTAIRSQSCDRAPIPATLQCSNGNCSTISLSGNEIASFTCYDWVGTNTTMQRAQMYQIMSLYSSVTMIADTNAQSVGINTLVPQSTLDVNGDTYLDGSGYIIGTPATLLQYGKTSIQLKELNNTESTPYTWWNTNCKWLSVDEAGHIILVQLPRTMCGATGSIVTPPTPTVINGACGSSHNTTGTSAPTSNLCSTGTASSVAGSGPWTWSCAGSNGGTSASCQMNKEVETNTNDLCINIIWNQEEIPNNYNIGFNNYCMPSLNSWTITNTYFDRTNLYRAWMWVWDGNAWESCREYLSRIWNMPLNSNLKTIYIDENGNSQEHLWKCVYEKPSGTSLWWQNNCRIGNPDDRFWGWNPSVYCSDTYQILQWWSTLVWDPNRQKTYRMKEYAPFTQTQSKSWNTTSNILSLFNTNPNQPLSGSVWQHCMDFIRWIWHDVNENEVDVNSLLGNQGQGSCLYAKWVTTVSIENYQFLWTIYTFNTTECKVVSSYDPAPWDNFYPTNYCNWYDQRAYKYR